MRIQVSELWARAWISVSRRVASKGADLKRAVRMLPMTMKGNVNVRFAPIPLAA